MDDLTDRLRRLAPAAPADPALADLHAQLTHHRRQRTALVALVAVLALVAAAAVIRGGGDDDGAIDPADDTQQVDEISVDAELVPAVFDGAPRLEPLRALPDCDHHDELEAWATTILDADFADYPQAGPLPDGPMTVAPLDEVASAAPVLLATDDGSPAVCVTSLAGPNDLVAWEQRDASGALVARAAAAPWASNLMPDLGGPTPELQARSRAENEAHAAADDFPLDASRWQVGSTQLNAFGPSLAGRGLSNGSAYPVEVDGRLGISMATANWDVRLQVDVLLPDTVAWDAEQLRRDTAPPLSSLILSYPGMVGSAVSQRLVWTAWSVDGSQSLALQVPGDWLWCGRAEIPPEDRTGTIDWATLLCGPEDGRGLLYSGPPLLEGEPFDAESGAQILVGPVADGRRRASASYAVASRGHLEQRSQVLDVPASFPPAVIVRMLESLPEVAGGPPVELAVPSGPDTAPSLRDLQARLGESGSALELLRFGWLRDTERDDGAAGVRVDDRNLEVELPWLPDQRVAIYVSESQGRWYLPSDSSHTQHLLAGRHVVTWTPSTGGEVEVATRCGRWALSLRAPRVDLGEVSALDLLADLADAFGCGVIPAGTVADGPSVSS